ncbi:MAG: oligosaccharide flippase family protein [bacterium]|nr:oligosaccharide flippase family protein [bacterium]
MIQKIKNLSFRLLKKSEKYTKTDMVYLAKGQFWLMLGQGISSLSSFLLAIAFANLLPKETYGTYKYVLSIFGILTISTLTGLNTVISQTVAHGHEGILLKSLKIKIKYGVLGCLASLGIAVYYYLQHNSLLAMAFLLISIFVPLMDSFTLYVAYLQGKKLFKESTIYLTYNRLIATAIMAATLFLTKNLYIILSVYFLSWIILRYWAWKNSLKKFPPNSVGDSKVMGYGKVSSLIGLTASLIGSLDMILLFHYMGAVAVAIYSFAIIPVQQFRRLFNQIPTLAMPKFAQRPIVEIEKLFWKRIFFLAFIGGLFSLVYIIIAPFVFKIFFPQYLDSIRPSQIFSIVMIINLALAVLGPLVNSRITLVPKKMLYLWNIPSIILVISISLTIKSLGIIGIMISQILSTASTFVISYTIWQKIKKIDKNNSSIE